MGRWAPPEPCFPLGPPSLLCCLHHQPILVAAELHLGNGCYILLMTGSGMARFSEGNLTKERMTQKLDQLLLPQALAAARPKMPAVCEGQQDTACETLVQTQEPWAFASMVSQPLLMGRSWEGSCPQMRLALSKEGRESGAGLQCSTARFIAAGTYVALASLVPSCPPSTQAGDAQRCRTCLWSFFPRERPNAEAVFQVFVFVLSVPR